jgi:hypothetical protein
MIIVWSFDILPIYKGNNLFNSMWYVGSNVKLGVGLVGLIGSSNFKPMHSSSWITKAFALFFATMFYIENDDHTNGDILVVANLGLMPKQLTT